MALFCEDLSIYSVVLIPPGSQQYFDLLADIERGLQNRPQGSPPLLPKTLSRIGEHDTSGSAILVNRAKVAIATLAYSGPASSMAALSPAASPRVPIPPSCFRFFSSSDSRNSMRTGTRFFPIRSA
jgi:hypothetical protein